MVQLNGGLRTTGKDCRIGTDLIADYFQILRVANCQTRHIEIVEYIIFYDEVGALGIGSIHRISATIDGRIGQIQVLYYTIQQEVRGGYLVVCRRY